MTLLELLVAMMLLSAMSGFLVQLMKNSFDLYEVGEKRGEHGVNATTVLSVLDDDLSNVEPGVDGRFLLERRRFGDGALAPHLFLRLIRTAPGGEDHHPVLRQSGTKGKAAGVWNGGDPGPGNRNEISPASGLIEVCYALVQEEADDPGVLTLYRGVHAPIMAGGSFFETENAPEYDIAWVRKTLTPLVTGILQLEILCWGPGTDAWGEQDTIGGRRISGSSFVVWDSTRGLLETQVFPFAVGPASARDTRDDLYPRRVRVVVTVGRPGRPDTRLRSELKPGDREIAVQSAKRLPTEGEEDRFVMIDGEWMEILRLDSGSAQVARERRASGSPKNPSPAGTGVYVGKPFRMTVELPFSTPNYGGLGQ